jgi:hypothetical protein
MAPRTPCGPTLGNDADDAGGRDGGQDKHDDEDGPEAERFGHEAAHVAIHSPDPAVDGGNDAHRRAEGFRLQVLAEDDVGEREHGAGDALQEAARDEQFQRGR